MSDKITWGHRGFQLAFSRSPDAPVGLVSVSRDGVVTHVHSMPVAEVLTAADGRSPASDRLAHTVVGSRLRYVEHVEGETDGASWLTVTQKDGGIVVSTTLEQRAGIAAMRARTEVRNDGDDVVVLRSVTSWSGGFTSSEPAVDALAGWERVSGSNDWLGEGRWVRSVLRGHDLPDLAEHLTGHNPRSGIEVTSDGTWSTGKHLPTAFLVNDEQELAWAWQVEHNGPWRWEIGEDTTGGYIAASGPTETDSGWTRVLGRGERFESVPVVVAFGTAFEGVVAELTEFRRSARRPHPDNAAMRVVFNDYMNTLDGDPTTEKLLPLIEAAASIGAEIFCIDAGWYDETGDWWDSVGEWKPSTTRFPNGLGEVIDAIRAAGMAPGLWLEPEVVGVRSPLVGELPLEAFLLRHGQRIREHDRYHLDLRHPAAVSHLDAVVDRLVADFGVEFFKFDYNIDPGVGTDHDSDSLGDGLLQHNRAHLGWLDGLLDRHPGLVIENCSSGAMRADSAMLSRLAMQSTSDQQDFVKFPPIAAAAPLSMTPEQAASWAYPQPEMSQEEASFALVTGLLGRYYVSGYINRMSGESRALTAEAVEAAKTLRAEIPTATPSWPLGLPGWSDAWVALALRGPAGGAGDLVSLWRRPGAEPAVQLSFPHLIGHDVTVSTVFPTRLEPWPTAWDKATGTLSVFSGDHPIAARTLRLRSLDPND
ncbi:glycoside hydrolase family 36 protein [Herbiconiux sp.]|uniref:glycoside hydrolase family 36 protein n=1 Tax=Herbiconiux sp. TaxID=1871186 RepID=UPI0025C4A38C|nr:glycoside hydrolase family 36 protein [Herbiconiux sp.]